MGGVVLEHHQSASTSEMREQCPPCWSSWKAPGWAGCLGRVLSAGGSDLGEDEMEEVELWAPVEEEGPGISGSSEEEDRPGPPP